MNGLVTTHLSCYLWLGGHIAPLYWSVIGQRFLVEVPRHQFFPHLDTKHIFGECLRSFGKATFAVFLFVTDNWWFDRQLIGSSYSLLLGSRTLLITFSHYEWVKLNFNCIQDTAVSSTEHSGRGRWTRGPCGGQVGGLGGAPPPLAQREGKIEMLCNLGI